MGDVGGRELAHASGVMKGKQDEYAGNKVCENWNFLA
jgi:hypothetical protein